MSLYEFLSKFCFNLGRDYSDLTILKLLIITTNIHSVSDLPTQLFFLPLQRLAMVFWFF